MTGIGMGGPIKPFPSGAGLQPRHFSPLKDSPADRRQPMCGYGACGPNSAGVAGDAVDDAGCPGGGGGVVRAGGPGVGGVGGAGAGGGGG
eukprot:15473074-Alexandrium_andersonii.AAC.1